MSMLAPGIVLAMSLAGTTPAGPSLAGPSVDPQVQLVTSGFTLPVAVRQAPGDNSRLFVVERDGVIRIIRHGQLLPTPFLDISDEVFSNPQQPTSETGLLGLAFHPDYQSNGLFYVYHNRRPTPPLRVAVARYQVTADPEVADPLSRLQLLEIPKEFANHNGGDIHFGPDGYLYFGTGDGGRGNDPCDRGQQLDPNRPLPGDAIKECVDGMEKPLLGKLLRIDVDQTTPAGPNGLCAAAPDGSAPYAVPPSNPFVPTIDTCDEIYAWGLRNPYRFSIDLPSGDIFIGDVGQAVMEEISLSPVGVTGLNFGWRCREGTMAGVVTPYCSTATFEEPILAYLQDVNSRCSVIGGYRYHRPGPLDGHYLFGDFCSGEIFSASEDVMGNWSFSVWQDLADFNLSGFGRDNFGDLYFTHLQAGEVYKLVPNLIFADGFPAAP